MKLVAYLRVSTEGQAEGLGLDVQEAACRSWARTHKHRIISVHSDIGVSGTDVVSRRPALIAALASLAVGEAGGLVVARLDRLARDLVLQETILADLHRVGLELHSASDTEDAHLADDVDDPTRALVRRILGAVASYERDLIRLRLRSGRARKAMQGGYAGGAPPFGWAATSAHDLAPIPAEQAAIAVMREKRTAGLSLQAIAADLNASNVPTRYGADWSRKTVARVLSRETVAGKMKALGSPRKEEMNAGKELAMT